MYLVNYIIFNCKIYKYILPHLYYNPNLLNLRAHIEEDCLFKQPLMWLHINRAMAISSYKIYTKIRVLLHDEEASIEGANITIPTLLHMDKGSYTLITFKKT